MKKMLFTPLAAVLLLMPQTNLRADKCDNFWRGVATIGACALGVAGIVGATAAIKYAYRPYTDSEEITFGKDLYQKVYSCSDQYINAYNRVVGRLTGASTLITDQDLLELDDSASKVYSTIQKTNKKITHLKEKQIGLSKNKKLSSCECDEYHEQYKQLCKKLKKVEIKLQTLHAHLKTVNYIANAKYLLQNTLSYYNQYTNTYSKALELFSGYNPEYASEYHLKDLDRLIRRAAQYGNELPYTSYSSELGSAIANINRSTQEINEKKSHLKKRQNDLDRNENLTSYERNTYYNQYEQLHSQLEIIQEKLYRLQVNLETVRSSVKSLNGYREDLREQRRIEEERRRREEDRRRREEARKQREELRKQREQMRMLEKQIQQLQYELNTPCDCNYCCINEYHNCQKKKLKKQLRKLINQRDDISILFS